MYPVGEWVSIRLRCRKEVLYDIDSEVVEDTAGGGSGYAEILLMEDPEMMPSALALVS